MRHKFLLTAARVSLLAALPIFNQACSDAPDMLADIEEEIASKNMPTFDPDSIYKFATIEELESLAPATLAEGLAEYELTQLSYECTDTIELRALRYDVTATLTSPAGQQTTLAFTADVGPELVSVEYYPGGEWIPAHDNMEFAFYPYVERYRNYSDGTRVGPDMFYDYGHPFWGRSYVQSPQTRAELGEFILSYNISTWGEGGPILVEDDYDDPKDGFFCTHFVEQIEINTNATVWMEGRQFSGEDLVPHHPNWWNTGDYYRFDSLTPLFGNYYSRSYFDSRLFDPKNEDLMICRNVRDASPILYPDDTRSLEPGFYFTDFKDKKQFEPYAVSKVWEYFSTENYAAGFTIGDYFDGHIQYLVIDGRIIHFDNLIMKDYVGMDKLTPTFSETKTAEGYNIHREATFKYLGANFKSIHDLRIKCTKGPKQEIYVWGEEYGGLNSGDQEELDKLRTTSRSSGTTQTPVLIERPDGKYVKIDRRLPTSIRSLQPKRTINTESK